MIRTNLFQASLACLGICLLAIFTYTFAEQQTIKRRVRSVERVYDTRSSEIKALEGLFDERITGLRRETEQQTTAINMRIDERFSALETLIRSLFSTLKANGVKLTDETPHPGGIKNGISDS